ncbi:MAG: hypothetical protein WC421_01435 [Elusimicrobiales bacterium]
MKGILLATPPLDVYEHMALDDEAASLEPADGFTLRVYNWNGGGATFGYAQFHEEAARAVPPGAPATRRPTGGGVVPHDFDMTFSCVFPPSAQRPPEIYALLHGAFYAALERGGVECSLCGGEGGAAAYAPSAAGEAQACFRNPVPRDIAGKNGGKILGGALRKYAGATLYQGSLQLPGARARSAETGGLFMEELSRALGISWTRADAPPSRLESARRLAAERYRSRQWIEKF